MLRQRVGLSGRDIQGIRSSKLWELWGALKPSEDVVEMADSKFWGSLERVPPPLLLPPNPSWGHLPVSAKKEKQV